MVRQGTLTKGGDCVPVICNEQEQIKSDCIAEIGPASMWKVSGAPFVWSGVCSSSRINQHVLHPAASLTKNQIQVEPEPV